MKYQPTATAICLFPSMPPLICPVAQFRLPIAPFIPAMATDSSTATNGSNTAFPRRIVICGGGVIGVCTAYFLASKGSTRVSVTVVERSSIACAASGKAGGFLALDWCDGTPVADLARASFLLHRSLADLLDGPSAYGYRALTTLSLPLSTSSAARSRAPVLPSWIDGSGVARPRTIGTLETTAQVHPQLFTRAVLSSAMADYGVQVVFGEVQNVEAEGTGVRLRDGRILPADVVVIALGPWSSRLQIISDLFHVSGLKAHSIVLRPQEPSVISPHALFLSYQPSPGGKTLDPEVYPRPSGEVYICGLSKEAPPPDNPEDIVGEPESIAMLHQIAGRVSSHLKAGVAETVAEQACFLPCTVDSLPVIGEIPGAKNCYVATGHSCWGILNAPATGAALAELILEGRSATVNLDPFSPARFLR
ncbi:hypothetical protein KFK09_016271 [Dendrobium nobile]|uniref:FAD dependent oxidoreductase domain-containing protein n=1 Tax=Dendrobium nobile TaxID=94219 RepID=A0A8T3AYX0_DENNO|nr:hypothetical protein KFK09_016271 [Dendrobium nobile]